MRQTLTEDEIYPGWFSEQLGSAADSLWRFERQRFYRIDDEAGLLADFGRGVLTPPDRAPGLRVWFDQVRDWKRVNGHLRVSRVRVVDNPPTEYQRWLQFVDRWNREAGEEIHYLPRWAISDGSAMSGLEPGAQPFGECDWWLIDRKRAVIMYRDAEGVRTKVEISEDRLEIADAMLFAWRAEQASIILEETISRAA